VCHKLEIQERQRGKYSIKFFDNKEKDSAERIARYLQSETQRLGVDMGLNIMDDREAHVKEEAKDTLEIWLRKK
jgi:hypothetical protein